MGDKDRIIERLAKIKALAEEGVGGEREAAKRLLEEVAKRHGIDFEHIATVKEQEYELKMREGWKLDLTSQIFGLMRLEEYGSAEAEHCRIIKRSYYGKPYRLFAICTQLQWVELNAKLEILAKDYARQLETFFRAFLEANDLLAPFDKTKEPTEEELEMAMAARKMASGIKRSVLRKQIEAGSPAKATKKLERGKP